MHNLRSCSCMAAMQATAVPVPMQRCNNLGEWSPPSVSLGLVSNVQCCSHNLVLLAKSQVAPSEPHVKTLARHSKQLHRMLWLQGSHRSRLAAQTTGNGNRDLASCPVTARMAMHQGTIMKPLQHCVPSLRDLSGSPFYATSRSLCRTGRRVTIQHRRLTGQAMQVCC
jgi:hypothetical protein